VALIVVIGLAGSGKTRYLKCLVRDGVVAREHARDDYHAHAPNLGPESSLHFADITAALRAGESCAIADVSFCRGDHLETVLAAFRSDIRDLEVQRVYFTNDPMACRRNVECDTSRTDADARWASIVELSPRYTPPVDALAVFAPSG
jgi:hypothetical protein